MQVNLRKANAIQSEIRKAITNVKADVNVSVTEFTTSIVGALEDASTKFLAGVKRKEQLNAALFDIRAAVGQANATVGISNVLAEVECIDGKMAILGLIANATVAKGFDEIHSRVEKMKNAPSDQTARAMIYGDRYSTVETSVVNQASIDQAKDAIKQLKRQKQDLQDKLLNLNVGTTITLSTETVQLLKEEGIL